MRFLLRLLLIFVLILILLRLVARMLGRTTRGQVGGPRNFQKPPEPSPPADDIRDAKFKDIPK
jgi:hypothetical protein